MEEEIDFNASIKFKGSREEFEKLVADLGKLREQGLKIETVPLPEKPKGKARGTIMIDTVPLPEITAREVEGLRIGTWPTPERGLVLETIPFPPKPFPGIWPITKLLSKELLDKITQEMPRIKINDIHGGIRNPHLHVRNEVVLLDRARWKEFVGQVALKFSKDLLG
ncbi:MAG: hypothetical protein ACFFCW_07180 [Candidatus Hodarchaeota archaeon]